MNIQKVIKKILKSKAWSSMSPLEINSGNCDSFAYDVEQKIPNSESVWADIWLDCEKHCDPHFTNSYEYKLLRNMDLAHCFVEYDKMFYDAECSNGVKHPVYLPYFQRQLIKK